MGGYLDPNNFAEQFKTFAHHLEQGELFHVGEERGKGPYIQLGKRSESLGHRIGLFRSAEPEALLARMDQLLQHQDPTQIEPHLVEKTRLHLRKQISAKSQTALSRVASCFKRLIDRFRRSSEKLPPPIQYSFQEIGQNLFEEGRRYLYGIKQKQDLELAFEKFQGAAKGGHLEAIYTTGYCYLKGIGVAKDMEKAKQWLQEASRLGHLKAKEALGSDELAHLYKEPSSENPPLSPDDRVEAKREASGRSAEEIAQWLPYLNRKAGEKKRKEAFAYFFEVGAKQGNPTALRALSECYSKGIGVEEDFVKADYYYQQALLKKSLSGEGGI